jgi:hypothetical protein
MNKELWAAFNEYREIKKMESELKKRTDELKMVLRPSMENNQLLDDETGELLMEVTVTKRMVFNAEDFCMIPEQRKLYEEYCYEQPIERLVIKARLPKE